MRSLAGLFIVALFAGLLYKFCFANLNVAGGASPSDVIDIVGVKNDLLGIAQAERAYFGRTRYLCFAG